MIQYLHAANCFPFVDREACAVESAIVRNPDLPSVVVFLASALDLSSNSTCQLHDAYAETRLFWRTVDPDALFAGSPIQGINRKLKGTKHWAPHMR